ncbi:dermokine-like isoform X2 [Dreissena polymorpha]|uniref:dermokine-like isoform X2 n=1 Tax=Dreissena polymorpha TaxID=45954 RepID=UPI002264C538|nr:dermokine-like isoform X2 [Dreissena polymorpha]
MQFLLFSVSVALICGILTSVQGSTTGSDTSNSTTKAASGPETTNGGTAPGSVTAGNTGGGGSGASAGGGSSNNNNGGGNNAGANGTAGENTGTMCTSLSPVTVLTVTGVVALLQLIWA